MSEGPPGFALLMQHGQREECMGSSAKTSKKWGVGWDGHQSSPPPLCQREEAALSFSVPSNGVFPQSAQPPLVLVSGLPPLPGVTAEQWEDREGHRTPDTVQMMNG